MSSVSGFDDFKKIFKNEEIYELNDLKYSEFSEKSKQWNSKENIKIDQYKRMAMKGSNNSAYEILSDIRSI